MKVLYRHIRLDKNEPFYIGIGNLSRAYCKYARNEMWNNIVKKTEYDVEIIMENLTWEQACEKEIEFIAIYGRRDVGTGTLCNMTDGGDGSPNVVHKEARKKIMSKKFSDGGNPRATSVYCESLNKSFDTISLCAKELGISQPYLSRMILGERQNKYGVKILKDGK